MKFREWRKKIQTSTSTCYTKTTQCTYHSQSSEANVAMIINAPVKQLWNSDGCFSNYTIVYWRQHSWKQKIHNYQDGYQICFVKRDWYVFVSIKNYAKPTQYWRETTPEHLDENHQIDTSVLAPLNSSYLKKILRKYKPFLFLPRQCSHVSDSLWKLIVTSFITWLTYLKKACECSQGDLAE